MRAEVVTLTQGNINNNHLYLTEVWSLFSADSIGGPSEAQVAPQLLEVHCGIGAPVSTDIAGDKKIFRKRAWVGEFFAAHDLKAGDRVAIQQTGPNRYHVFPAL